MKGDSCQVVVAAANGSNNSSTAVVHFADWIGFMWWQVLFKVLMNIKFSTTQFVIGLMLQNTGLESTNTSQQLYIYNAFSIYYSIYSVEM